MLCTRFIHGPAVGAARHQFFDISATVLTFNHLLYPPPIYVITIVLLYVTTSRNTIKIRSPGCPVLRIF